MRGCYIKRQLERLTTLKVDRTANITGGAQKSLAVKVQAFFRKKTSSSFVSILRTFPVASQVDCITRGICSCRPRC